MVRFSEFAENSGQRWVALVERAAVIEKKLDGAAGVLHKRRRLHHTCSF